METNWKAIGIVGTGLIGASWAAWFAARGFLTRMYDPQPAARQQGLSRARACLASLHRHGLLGDLELTVALERLEVVDQLDAAVRDVGLVQESASENYEVKLPLFEQIDAVTDPATIVASSSSGLLITRLQQAMRYPERSLIAHPFNPPHLMPLVELVPGERTAPQTVETTRQFFAEHGKVPVVLRKEIPGHVANRFQAALWREAIELVRSGVVSVEDVDRALTAGPGLRWALLGSHQIFHLGGGSGGIEHFIEHIGRGWDALWNDLAAWTSLPEDTASFLGPGVREALGGRTTDELVAWRDARLVELLRSLERQAGNEQPDQPES